MKSDEIDKIKLEEVIGQSLHMNKQTDFLLLDLFETRLGRLLERPIVDVCGGRRIFEQEQTVEHWGHIFGIHIVGSDGTYIGTIIQSPDGISKDSDEEMRSRFGETVTLGLGLKGYYIPAGDSEIVIDNTGKLQSTNLIEYRLGAESILEGV